MRKTLIPLIVVALLISLSLGAAYVAPIDITIGNGAADNTAEAVDDTAVEVVEADDDVAVEAAEVAETADDVAVEAAEANEAGDVDAAAAADFTKRLPGSNTCTLMAVGKNATVDGSVISAQTWDIWNSGSDVNLRYIPAADHEPGETRTVECFNIYDHSGDNPILGGKTIEIPEVPHTYAVIQCEIGIMNEHQVSFMASTNCEVRPELSTFTTPVHKWKVGEPYGSETHSDAVLGISEAYQISLERAKTAREAVQVLTSLYEKYGFDTAWAGTGETAMIADPNEIWVVDVMPVGPDWRYGSGEPGALWAAMRVPDDAYFMLANETPIGEIDLSDPDRMMASSNVFSFAEERGWWDSSSEEPFRWDEVYGDGPPNSARHFMGVSLAAPSLNLKPLETYPSYVKPDKKLSVLDIREIYLSRYEGTVSDRRNQIAAGPYNNPWWPVGTPGWLYGIPSQSTRRLTIAQSRDWLPAPIGGVLWHGFGNPVTNILTPIYAGVTRLPEALTIGNTQFYNPDSAFWTCNLMDVLAQTCYSPMIEKIRAEQISIESRLLVEQKGIDFTAYELYRNDEAAGREYLTNYCMDTANEALEQWRDLFGRLIVEYDALETSATAPAFTNQAWVEAVKAEQERIDWPGTW